MKQNYLSELESHIAHDMAYVVVSKLNVRILAVQDQNKVHHLKASTHCFADS